MKRILPVIVISQFLCTSVWFAGNAVLSDLIKALHLSPGFLVQLTTAVQMGFICGTLLFAVLALADRFSPSYLFCTSALFAAGTNGLIGIPNLGPAGILSARFLTGFFLAGIYPVGMKIAADHFAEGLGKSLGWLVGALVFGTSLPHLLKTLTLDLDWKTVVFATSGLAIIGGLLIRFFVPDGPHRKKGGVWNVAGLGRSFSIPGFRGAASGYFGHMWELYAFWTFVPVILAHYVNSNPATSLNVSLWSFVVIAVGGVACILAGFCSQRLGPKQIATVALALSGCCCLLSPLMIGTSSLPLLLLFLVCWGMFVVADSPLFSTLVAQNAPATSRGTALTIVNCIGFTITILSIQLLNILSAHLQFNYLFLVLSPGPILGILALWRNR
ncbi:MAG: MFS transporter [Ferruginibacter sp.]|nr:MFS transporter [Ferruginibacter sp.]